MSTRARATSMRAVRHGAARRRSAIATAVQQLQAAGRRGVLPPPQDISRGMFWRDRNRTQPYTEADKERTVEFVDDLTGNPVGWQLGQDLVINGTFVANLSGWTLSQTIGATLPAWSAGSMRLVSDGSGFSRADQQLTTIPNRNYRLWVFVVTPGSGSCDVRLGTTQGASDILSVQSITATGWQSYPFVPTTSSTWIRFSTGSNNATGYLIDTVVAKEVILDESWLGPNLFTGGSFEADTAGASGIRCDVARSTVRAQSGTASLLCTVNNNTGASRVERSLMTVGRCYQVEAWVYLPSGQTTTALQIVQAGVTTSIVGAFSTSVTNTWVRLQAIVGAISPNIGVGSNAIGAVGDQYWVDEITVREIPGHPIVSAVAGSGLVLSRRVNILQRTENFTNSAAWSATGSGVGATPTVTNNFAAAPDGTITAGRLQVSLNGGTTTSDQSLLVQVATGSSVKGSWWVKTNDGSTKTIYLRGATAVNVQVNGTWQEISFNAGNMSGTQFGIGLRGGQGTVNSDSADLLIWHPDLRPTFWDQFPGIPAYQRVNDGTAGVLDYDDSPAFPLHWRNVTGTQAMMTLGTVDMSAGDAGAIIAGCVKLTDSTQSVLAEFGTTPLTVAGTITAATANLATGAGTGYSVRAKGSSPSDAVSTGQPSPHVASVIAEGDISTDLCRLVVNGSQVATSTADQGTGNLGNHRFNIAGRDVGGTANLRFTGILLHLPVLVAADAGIDLQALAREYAASAGFIY